MIHKPTEFEDIYAGGGWDSQGSGPGSTEAFTRGFREVLERLLVEKHIFSVFDLGCGDWQWQRHVKWPSVAYTGWDVSKTAVCNARIAMGKTFRASFEIYCQDAFTQPLWPEADLLTVKDVVHHVSPFRVRMLREQARLYSFVLWVVDVDGGGRPCNWIGDEPAWQPLHIFDTSPPYPYGPKIAYLQENP